MKIKLKGISGLYVVGECGIVDIEYCEEPEKIVENNTYQHFDKKELFWTIYDQIIIPTREKMKVDPDHTFRLLCIEDKSDGLVLHYNIDDYDESYSEVQNILDISLEDLISAVFDDFCYIVEALPDDEPLKKSITWDKTRAVNIPEDFLKRLKRDVFYSSWDIDASEK